MDLPLNSTYPCVFESWPYSLACISPLPKTLYHLQLYLCTVVNIIFSQWRFLCGNECMFVVVWWHGKSISHTHTCTPAALYSFMIDLALVSLNPHWCKKEKRKKKRAIALHHNTTYRYPHEHSLHNKWTERKTNLWFTFQGEIHLMANIITYAFPIIFQLAVVIKVLSLREKHWRHLLL